MTPGAGSESSPRPAGYLLELERPCPVELAATVSLADVGDEPADLDGLAVLQLAAGGIVRVDPQGAARLARDQALGVVHPGVVAAHVASADELERGRLAVVGGAASGCGEDVAQVRQFLVRVM